MNRLLSFLTALILAAALGPELTAARPTVTANDTLKAEYVFLEAANHVAEEQATDRYMLLRHAGRLKPSDPFIAGSVAELDLMLDQQPSAQSKAYLSLQRRFRAMPTEPAYYEPYANIAFYLGNLDDALEVWTVLDSLQPSRTDPAMNMASVYIAKANDGDSAAIAKAIAIYDRLQAEQPASFALALAKIKALNAVGDTAAMLAETSRVLAAAPSDRMTLLGGASIYRILGMPDSALSCINRASTLYPDDGTVSRERAGYYYLAGDTATFRREVAKAIASTNLDFSEKYSLFGEYLNDAVADSTDNPETARLFALFQEVNPGEPRLHQLYGEYLAARGNYSEAAEQLRYSVDLDPTAQDVWDKLLQAYAQSNDSVRLYTAAHTAAAKFRDDIYAALMAATASYVRDEFDAAIAVLDSVRFMPTHNPKAVSQVHSFKGDIYSRIEMPDSAIASYNRAIEIDADNTMALNNAAYFMAEAGTDLPRAEAYAAIACASDPTSVTFLDTYAWIMFKKRDYARALELMERALALIAAPESSGEPGEEAESTEAADGSGESAVGDFFEIYSHAGDIYFMGGQPEKAVEYWQKALELHPDDELLRRKVTNRAYYYE